MRYFVTGYYQYGKKAMGLRPARHRPALRDSGVAGGDCEFRDYTLVTLAHFKL
jgi:hypothetical protein